MKKNSYFILQLLIASVALLLINGCSKLQELPPRIHFALLLNNERVKCGQPFMLQQHQWQLSQLQFYVSNIQYVDEQQKLQSLKLSESNYQHGNTALIGQVCGNKGNWQLTFDDKINVTTIRRLRFTLGVPFFLNHENPMTLQSPLNEPSMFWIWQTGHKFLRLELLSENDNWLFHLGSTGCQSASPLRKPEQNCMHPNRFDFTLNFEPTHEQKINNIINVSINLANLLNEVTLTSESSCQSEPSSKVCINLLNKLANNHQYSVFQLTN